MSDLTIEVNKKNVKKPALGRGLGSLLGQPSSLIKEKVEDKTEKNQNKNVSVDTKSEESLSNLKAQPKIPDTMRIWKVDIEQIFPNMNQPRQVFDSQALKELSDSIKEKGILQPIVARKMPDGGYEIIAGERRWRAAQLAGLTQVPIILNESDDQSALELALIENIQRADLNPIEEAEAYAHLVKKYQLTQQKLAEKVGKDRVTVANLMRLLNLAPEVRGMVSKGEISLGQAKVLLSIENHKLQKQLANKVKNDKLSVRATERLVINSFKNKEIEQENVGEINISQRLAKGLAEELQKKLGTKVSIDYNGGQGKLSISFYSDEELNRMVDKIRNAWQKS